MVQVWFYLVQTVVMSCFFPLELKKGTLSLILQEPIVEILIFLKEILEFTEILNEKNRYFL